MSNTPGQPSLADLAKAQIERKRAVQERVDEAARQDREIKERRGNTWATIVHEARRCCADVSDELTGLGMSVSYEAITAPANSMTFGEMKVAVRQSLNEPPKEELRIVCSISGHVALHSQNSGIYAGDSPSLYLDRYKDGDIDREIRTYIAGVFEK
ncbi:hypothetical protein [Methylobacterium cerastii]|uniref:hypothetical protein n=1 Tax=Methylobacterium cerastii TaxID=932741 RepID=UPI001EE38C49|nr:hypothetical protein [Methylobacterium cerastii]